MWQTLTRAQGAKDDFTTYEQQTVAEDTQFYTRGDGSPQHVVIVLPDFSGSHLVRGTRRIWADPSALMSGGLADLHLTVDGVTVQGLAMSSYGKLCEHLRHTFDVMTFPYDWRRSVLDTAQLLAKTLEQLLHAPRRQGLPISLLAHGMGGLVAYALIATHDALWSQLCARINAPLVMLGTPYGGSHAITAMLLSRNRLSKQLALLDPRHSSRDILALLSSFPGVLELLPQTAGDQSVFQEATWKRWQEIDDPGGMAWAVPAQHALAAAQTTHRQLASTITEAHLQHMRYVAGRAAATPIDIQVTTRPDGSLRLMVLATEYGDGRVPWNIGIPQKLPTWYVDAAHGDLVDSPETFPGLVELLQQGNTALLSKTPPAARGNPERFEMPPEPPPLFPTEQDVLHAGLGRGKTGRLVSQGPRAAVTVVHGNLAFASYPLMAGHYSGDTLVSAEAHLNRVLGGRLTARQQLGLYPGAIDTCEVFLDNAANPPGAIIIGLGEVGVLHPLALVQAITRGVRSYALTVQETHPRPAAGPTTLGIGVSTLLIGTGAGGFTVTESVEAILRGIALANETLTTVYGRNTIRIDQVEFIELYADRAIQAAQALASARKNTRIAHDFLIDEVPQVHHRTGGIHRAYYQEDPAWWLRLQIVERQGQLVFSSLTDRARAEVSLHATQLASVETFVRGLSTSTATDVETSIALYEMLVPHDLKERARERGNLVLVLDARSARYPWELMQEKQLGDSLALVDQQQPLAVASGLVRQLHLSDFRPHAILSTRNAALVVGDPPTHLPPLPGARQEAHEVTALLRTRGYKVDDIIRREDQPDTATQAEAIWKALFVQNYRIVHLAGHGMPQTPNAVPPSSSHEASVASGMAIGPHCWLTVEHIQSLRPVPEMVFVNCCHLGQTTADSRDTRVDFPRLAANIGGALIAIGVKVVVAAGWAVEDAAARCFARAFYEAMLSGETFGDAVRHARECTYAGFPAYNTWGAYQCYGDPAYRMTVPRVEGPQRHYTFSSWLEPVVELRNIVERAKNVQPGEIDLLVQEIRAIEHAVPAPWLQHGELHTALGAAYGELQRFEPAIAHYQKALASEDGQSTLHAVEQLCNLEVRFAQTLSRIEAIDRLNQAIGRLNALCAVSSTAERHSLRASATKRQFMLLEDTSTYKESLDRMVNDYLTAYTLSSQAHPKDFDPYPLVNYVAVRVVLDPLQETPKPIDIEQLLRQAEQAAQARDQHTPEFWNAVIAPDCEVVRALYNRNLSTRKEEILQAYRQTLARSGSPREWDSVVEQFTFLLRAVRLWESKDPSSEAALESIQKALRAM